MYWLGFWVVLEGCGVGVGGCPCFVLACCISIISGFSWATPKLFRVQPACGRRMLQEHIKHGPQGNLCPYTTQTVISLSKSLGNRVEKTFFLWSRQCHVHNLVSSTAEIVHWLISGGLFCISRSVCNSWRMKHRRLSWSQWSQFGSNVSFVGEGSASCEKAHGRMSCCSPERYFYNLKRCVHQDKRYHWKQGLLLNGFCCRNLFSR